jgi:chromosome partitioning protein
VLAGVRAVRLGELSDPRYLPEDTLVTPTAPVATAGTPTPPPASVVRTTTTPEVEAGPRVIAVFNQKGGTAKTTTAVHVAAGLARAGHRVLLVDTDGQGNAGASLGVRPDRTLYHVLVMGLPFSDAVVEVRDGLHVLPSNETLAAAELYLSGQRQRDRILATRLAGARAAYEYVIVDCSPSLSLLNQNALVFADAVLCPVACDFLSLYGVRQVVRTVKQVNRLLGHSLSLWGVLPTLYDSRARICREALETLRNTFGDACLDPVHFAIRAKEAPAQGKTLFEYAPSSPAAADYARVVARLRGERQTTLREAAGGSR